MENWAKSIEKDMKTISGSLEYAYKGSISALTSGLFLFFCSVRLPSPLVVCVS